VREIEHGETAFPYLSNHQRISLQIALSSVHDQLPAGELGGVLEQVDTVVRLNEDSNLLLMYLESCMQAVAPNLCQLLGSLVASKLISIAGGVKELAAIPACNIQVMGGQRAGQVGLNLDRNHTGVFGQMDIVRDAPP
jgi:U4/U6 small nuclear ribonucleoprotein PRP31